MHTCVHKLIKNVCKANLLMQQASYIVCKMAGQNINSTFNRVNNFEQTFCWTSATM